MFARFGAFLLVLSMTTAHVVREAPNPTNDQVITKSFDDAVKGLKEIESKFLDILGFQDAQQLREKAVEQGKQLTTQLDKWAVDIKEQTESLKDNNAVKEIRASVEKTIKDLSEKYPETATDIKSFVSKANVETEQVVTKIRNLGETAEAKQLKDLSAQLLNTAADAFQNIVKDIRANIEAKPH